MADLAAASAAVVVALGLVVGLSGCKVEGAAKAKITVPTTVKAAGWPRPVKGDPGSARPVRVLVPRAGVDAPVVSVSTEKGGKLGAPPIGEANLVGWDRTGATPGEGGAAVLVGHLDTKTGPAVFAKLSAVKKGDTVAVVRSDNRVVVFRATATEEVGKSDFPVRKVFGDAGRAAVRLVTCGGRFDRARHSYDDNLIVYGDHVATYRLADL